MLEVTGGREEAGRPARHGSEPEAPKILLVDDLEENLFALEALLADLDQPAEVLKARSGREALELLLVHQVALALVDVHMPEMSGFELAELMRGTERTRRVPIILVTAASQDQQRVFEGYGVGAVDFLFKPIEPRILLGKVRTFLELHRHEQRMARLQEVTAAFARLLRPGEVADVGLPAGVRAVGASVGTLMLLDRGGTHLELAGSSGLTPEEMARIRRIPLDSETAVAEALRSRAPVFVEAEAERQRRFPRARELLRHRLGTRAALPLVAHGRVLGVLGFGFAAWRALSGHEKAFLGALADQCAQALERVRLLEAERAARRELRQERDFVRSLLDTLGALVVVLDRDGRIVRWNPACELTTGYSLEEVQGAPVWERLVPAAEVEHSRRAFAHLVETRAASHFESHWVSRSGETRWIAWSNTVMLDEAGDIQFVIGTGVDRTDRRLSELERERLLRDTQEALRTREEFIAMASHDIRSPLFAVVMQLQLLQLEASKRQALESSWLAGRLDRMHRNLEQSVQLMDDLLEQARADGGELEVELADTDLFATVQEHVARCREQLERAGCAVSIRGEGPVRGRWDRLRLEQAFGNLLSNAIKYGRGKPIEIEIEATGAHARLRVRDHGVGIPAEEHASIFEKFRRASSEGRAGSYGLGLWIVRRVVTALGGRVSLESEPGRGACFTVELPLAGPERAARHA